MIRYKLTDANGKTRDQMAWANGVTNRATGEGKDLCTNGWLHVYDSPEQAAFMLPAHVPDYTRLWKVECPDEGITDGTKRGVKTATVLREIKLPRIEREERLEIGIRCAMTVCKDKVWRKWARGWINGSDRSKTAAYAAANAAYDAAYAAANAAYAAANAAYDAAYAAADAAYAAYDAAYAAAAANAAYDAYDAAYAAAAANAAYDAAAANAYAANAANAAAYAANAAAKPLDMCGIIKRVMEAPR